jgi:hypothetical protein
MPIELGLPVCRAVSPSAPSELAWILNLLTQTARYAEPAIAELDASLLPGSARLRADRFAAYGPGDASPMSGVVPMPDSAAPCSLLHPRRLPRLVQRQAARRATV